MNKIRTSLLRSLIVSLLPGVLWAGPVDINSADAETLARELDGIGDARARAIVEYREANGPFRSVDELLNVKGVGARVLEQNRGNILLESPESKSADK